MGILVRLQLAGARIDSASRTEYFASHRMRNADRVADRSATWSLDSQPGGRLACAEGAAVQFSYTAPRGVRLSVAAKSPSGEVFQFFPREGEAAPVTPGVDVSLPYSTPVQGGWLTEPMEVRALFTDEKGQVVGQTAVTLTLAK